MYTLTNKRSFDRKLRWLRPSGNLGDHLLLSSVLRAGHEATGERFGILRTQPASSLFMGHPAVGEVATIDEAQVPLQRTDYWNLSFANHPKTLRPFARLSLMLFQQGLQESFWAPIHDRDREILKGLPFKDAPIVLGCAADSPRSAWPAEHWKVLATRLAELTQVPVVQVGSSSCEPIPGVLSVVGCLNAREILALLQLSQACVSVEPLVTHGARMHDVPCINLFGPHDPQHHGHAQHLQISNTAPCEAPCLEADREPGLKACPMKRWCMQEISPESVAAAFEQKILPSLVPGKPLLS